MFSFLIVYYGKSIRIITGAEDDNFDDYNKWYLQMGYLLCNMLLHYQCIDSIRNGVYMMRQTYYNPNAFSHPLTGFFLGLTNVMLYTVIETMNMLSGLSTKSLDTMIAKFMAYSILLQIPVIYVNQKKMFNVKFDVADFYLTIKEESVDLSESLR